MKREHAIEHLETALGQRDPARRLRLVALALRSDPRNPAGLALAALSVPTLDLAAPFLERAAEAARDPRSLSGLGRGLRSCVEAALAVRDLASLRPHDAADRAMPALSVEGPAGTALKRIAMAACAATGDVEGLSRALAASEGDAALARETAWFGYLLARETGSASAPALLAAAMGLAGGVAACLDGDGPLPVPGNPGALDGCEDSARAAVLPALFRAGGLPDGLPLAA